MGAAAVGGLIGGLIGADMDRRRCELARVAKQYDLQIEMADISAEGQVALPPAAASQAQPGPTTPESGPVAASGGQTPPASSGQAVGLSVNVSARQGLEHFESGSDQLTPRAREYFALIAKQYAPSTGAGYIPDANARQKFLSDSSKKKILLVGHTDDTGSSALNADLSERRARAVAAILRQSGVAEETLYFQGAGETLPIADNRTEQGRASNRRVEIVELADEGGFKKYLAARVPRYEFYRPASTRPQATAQGQAADSVAANQAPKSTAQARPNPPPRASAKAVGSAPVAVAKPDAATAKSLDFGGQRYDEAAAVIDIGRATINEAGFSFMRSAYASDTPAMFSSCHLDRPRQGGEVRALRSGSSYSISEMVPGLYGKTWADMVNGHLVVLNKVAVLREGVEPAAAPELKVYRQYQPDKAANLEPFAFMQPAVNVYRGSKGILYRVFSREVDAPIQCLDVLFDGQGGASAKAGRLVYSKANVPFVSAFQPRMNAR